MKNAKKVVCCGESAFKLMYTAQPPFTADCNESAHAYYVLQIISLLDI